MKYILILFVLLISACQSAENKVNSEKPWVGTWQMVGYDKTSVASRDTLIYMSLNDDFSFEYKISTRNGDVLRDDKARYEINDQHSVISVYENDKKVTEYFIRKVDVDSLIFQSDTFSILWKRVIQ